MAAQLNQSELVDLIRNVIREENQAERLVLRSAIREEINIAMEKVQSQLNAMDVTITQCKEKSAEVPNFTKLKDKIECLEMHSRTFNMRVFGLDNGI